MDLTINKLFHKLIPDTCLDYTGKIKEEFKYKINVPELKIQNSKFIPNPEDKFETMLFLPPNPNRIAEGGLRTKGLFKFSYKLGMLNDELYKDAKNSTFNANHSTLNIQNLTLKEIWHICDLDGNPVIPAPDDIQNKINNYVSQFQRETPQFNIQHSTFNIISELPLITVITVVYNGAKYLEETIQSVINQTYPNVEYIIIDGGSTDGTLDIIKKHENYIDYWVSEPDKGIYDAWNKGVIVAIGNWVSFLGSGDIYYKEALCKYSTFILENKSNYLYISSMIDLKKNKHIIRTFGKQWNYDFFKRYMNVAHVGSLHSLKFFKDVGLFDVNFKIAGDYELLLRKKNKLKAGFLDEITASMQIDGVSNNSIKVFFEAYTAKKRHTNKNTFLLYIELGFAILKWYLRKLLWY